MFSQIGEVAPRSVVLAAAAWALLNYAVIGPEVATRVVRADHIPSCEAGFQERVIDAAESEIAALSRPEADVAKEQAVASLRAMQDSPMMRSFRESGLDGLFGLGAQTEIVTQAYQTQKRRAVEAYQAAVETVKQRTATRLGQAGAVCGCLADAAIDESRTDWAIFSGTLSLIRTAKVTGVEAQMARLAATGVCDKAGGMS